MSRTQRLLDLIQILRSHRFPITGAGLAAQLGISIRTLYRDIRTLQQQGACIDGETGIGYVLRPGFMLPPLMFTVDEIEALVLGSRWVAEQGDAQLKAAARNVLSKISAVLPSDLRETLDVSALLVGSGVAMPTKDADLPQIRQAIRSEHKLKISYLDTKGDESVRTIWPFALGYFDHVRVLVAWCELRQGFRHFRTDRIFALEMEEHRYPRRRQVLLKEWREIENIPLQ